MYVKWNSICENLIAALLCSNIRYMQTTLVPIYMGQKPETMTEVTQTLLKLVCPSKLSPTWPHG